jgi:hypothetical protein
VLFFQIKCVHAMSDSCHVCSCGTGIEWLERVAKHVLEVVWFGGIVMCVMRVSKSSLYSPLFPAKETILQPT